MRMRWIAGICAMLTLICLGFAGCSDRSGEGEENKSDLWPSEISVGELYGAFLGDVGRVEIRDGSSGEQIRLEEEAQIEELATLLWAIELQEDADQGDRTGWQYEIKCYGKADPEKWMVLVIGGSGVADNFRSDREINSSPYYQINHEEALVRVLDGYFSGLKAGKREDSPYYLGEYYKELGDGRFEILSKDPDILENLKHFDFEYYAANSSDQGYARVFYLMYEAEGTHYLESYGVRADMEAVELEIPEADGYWLITDTMPTFSAEVLDTQGLENVSMDFFDSYSKGYRTKLSEGGSPNPRKILFEFSMNAPTAVLVYEDRADSPVRETTVQLRVGAQP